MRYKWIDELKGILIVLVIIGHGLQLSGLTIKESTQIVYNIIYAFHMPLFFAVSGYVSHKKCATLHEVKDKLIKDIYNLYIPYVALTNIYLIQRLILYGEKFHFPSTILFPAGPAWFLLALFVYRNVYRVLNYIGLNALWIWGSVIVYFFACYNKVDWVYGYLFFPSYSFGCLLATNFQTNKIFAIIAGGATLILLWNIQGANTLEKNIIGILLFFAIKNANVSVKLHFFEHYGKNSMIVFGTHAATALLLEEALLLMSKGFLNFLLFLCGTMTICEMAIRKVEKSKVAKIIYFPYTLIEYYRDSKREISL